MTCTKAEPIKKYCKSKQVMCEDVVRCEDCIQMHIGGSVTQYCWCDLLDREVDYNNGCSWGERKGGDDE